MLGMWSSAVTQPVAKLHAEDVGVYTRLVLTSFKSGWLNFIYYDFPLISHDLLKPSSKPKYAQQSFDVNCSDIQSSEFKQTVTQNHNIGHYRTTHTEWNPTRMSHAMCCIDLNSVTSDSWNKIGGNSGTPNGATCSWKATGCYAFFSGSKLESCVNCLMFVLTQVLVPYHPASGILMKVVDWSLVSQQMQLTNVLGFCPAAGAHVFSDFGNTFDWENFSACSTWVEWFQIVLIRIPCSPKLEAKIRAMGFWRSSR